MLTTRHLIGAGVAVVLLATGCGNRRDLEAFPPVEVLNVGTSTPAAGAPASGASVAPAPVTADTSAAAAPSASGMPSAAPAAAPSGRMASATPAAGPAPAAASPAAKATESGRPASSAPAPAAAASGAPATPAPGSPAAPAPGAQSGCPAPCGPVVVGHVGSYSGVFSGFANGYRAVEAWGGLMNERGGIDGHPVKVIVAEDGGDPARHLALVRQLVEEQGAIAFAGCFCPTTGASAVDYLNKKKVPVIGGNPSTNWYYRSLMHFPQTSLSDGYVKLFAGSTAEVAVPQGKRKLAILACSEIQVCKDEAQGLPKYAPGYGMEVVYSGQASLAQPDYTAECLAARNAGAEVMALAFDPNSYPRIARSCTSVGYKPLFSLVADVTNATAQIDVMEGALVGNPVRAWTDLAHPGVAEMHRAFKVHARNGEVDNTAGMEWVSAKALEKAVKGRLSPTPSSQDVLRGLYTMKGDDLGGLTHPLTYAEGVDEEPLACWSLVIVSSGKWTSPRPDVRCG
jgi:branched-chain amino acid transport system substrate-binding protein